MERDVVLPPVYSPLMPVVREWKLEGEMILSPETLPARIRVFLRAHYRLNRVLRCSRSVSGRPGFLVTLDNCTRLRFNEEGRVTGIAGVTELPGAILPTRLLSYIQDHFPHEFIRAWDRPVQDGEPELQGVDLSNGLLLAFDRSGNFLRVD